MSQAPPRLGFGYRPGSADRLEALAGRLEALASRVVEAIATSIAIRLEAIAEVDC